MLSVQLTAMNASTVTDHPNVPSVPRDTRYATAINSAINALRIAMSVRIQALAPTARVTNARPVLLSDARTETAFSALANAYRACTTATTTTCAQNVTTDLLLVRTKNLACNVLETARDARLTRKTANCAAFLMAVNLATTTTATSASAVLAVSVTANVVTTQSASSAKIITS